MAPSMYLYLLQLSDNLLKTDGQVGLFGIIN